MNIFQTIFHLVRTLFMSRRALEIENRALRWRLIALREADRLDETDTTANERHEE